MTDPIIKRGATRSVIGVEVDTLNVSLLLNSDVEVNGIPLAKFAMEGGFDGARLELDRSFAASWTAEACGSLNLFTGRVAEVTVTGTEVQLTVNSDLELLNVQMPRNVYQDQCIHTVYDPGCGLSPAAFTVTANTTSGSSRTLINCNLAQSNGYFDLGTVTFTTGSNAGESRTVKRYTTGALVPSFPLPYVPAAGDLFTAKPGCDGLRATCNTRFSNEANIRIYPYIPVPEAAL
jgi:uncharacterized phage protein (TIGR02218 family)